ncbi:putative peptidyl-tRNA hydrolase ICT1 mitochondrial isoform 2 [Scophthalmus maximus]|uniref:Putative peptidyl-tRNA hydrolase ICT1 mitochondrial isoform 2 n=1 Tax=Scophthalmus maximus TaxID=52904 RepID=A0A2U9CMR3_SCOMX|nr:putative peptidyl-tRNA hydrolase ICT1 mitochondrial isoform 2 [Scophthalmus maximus]
MAAHIVRRCYLFSRPAAAVNVNALRRIKPHRVLVADVNASQPSVGYGTRDSDLAQDSQVHIPVVSTKAEVRFHVHTADWIPEDVRQKIFEKNKSRINKAGQLLVTSELSRSQHRNLSDCIQKISAIIADASKKPHEPSAEDVALRAERLDKRNKERLKQKKIHSTMKQSRRVDFD